MNNSNKDIIAALATPYGRSALAAIRISGEGCIQRVQKFLKRPLEVGNAVLNTFFAQNFEEQLVSVCYKAPRSFSGEDTVELFPHGNMTVCDGIIKTLIDDGIRAAERGEFTKRAFINGKLNLMQCEALADIIDAQTVEQLNYGNKRYSGGIKTLDETEELLKKALSTVEAVLHYSDELEENETDQALINDVYLAVDEIIKKLEAETKNYAGGRIVNEGFKIALIGNPNVGKSTLLNALTESDRAIVTDVAGTTRDIIDGSYVFKDKKFTVLDTAGICETTDKVEKIGVERSLAAAKKADAVVFVTANNEVAPIDAPPAYTVINKCDDVADVGELYEKAEIDGKLMISAKTGKNITALKKKLFDLCPKETGGICNHRQYDCVKRCLEAVKAAKREIGPLGLEIVAAELYEAYSAIAELYGEKADENVITAVFERFCVGK